MNEEEQQRLREKILSLSLTTGKDHSEASGRPPVKYTADRYSIFILVAPRTTQGETHSVIRCRRLTRYADMIAKSFLTMVRHSHEDKLISPRKLLAGLHCRSTCFVRSTPKAVCASQGQAINVSFGFTYSAVEPRLCFSFSERANHVWAAHH